MVYDIAGSSFVADDEPVNESVPEDPNHQKFRKLLVDANTPLWGPTEEGCKTFSKLSSALFALNLKSEYRIPQACFNTLLQGWYDSLPVGNLMPRTLYTAKKEVELLGLSSVTYDVCPSGCMLYYGDDAGLDSCKFYPAQRYKTIERQRKTIHKPVKKMYYFHIRERLRRLFESNT